jgi:hypothetical protein
VKRGEYPERIPLVDGSEIMRQIEDLKNERVERPPTKQEYFALLESLELQFAAIKLQNEQANTDNQKARKAVDDKFLSDIETAKKDPANIREAEVRLLVYRKSLEQAATALETEAKITTKEKEDYIAKFDVTGAT